MNNKTKAYDPQAVTNWWADIRIHFGDLTAPYSNSDLQRLQVAGVPAERVVCAIEAYLDTRRPGRFDGEPAYVPYFWQVYLDGGADRDDGRILGFDLSPTDRLLFPDLRGRRTVKLYEDDCGFVGEA